MVWLPGLWTSNPKISNQLLQRIGGRIEILYDPAFFHEKDAAADIRDMVDIVAAHKDGHLTPLLPLLQHVDQTQLGGRIEVGEGLVEDQHLRFAEDAGGNTHLELITFGKIADVFSTAKDAAVKEGIEVPEEIVDIRAGTVVQGSDKIKIFFRCKVVDQEALVEVGGRVLLPVFGGGDILVTRKDLALIGADKVKDEPEERGLSGAVIPYQTDDFTPPGRKLRNVDDDLAVVRLDNIVRSDHSIYFGEKGKRLFW